MNTRARPSALLPAADAPDAPARRRWTLAEVEHMVAAGVIAETERIELIDGEIVAMSPKGLRHENLRVSLTYRWTRHAPSDVMIAPETTLRLDPATSPEPDIILFPMAIPLAEVRGDNVLLVVEIADSSASYDVKVKSVVYAAFGVREYWVIDARSLVTTVHRDLRDEGYADVAEVPGTELIAPIALPLLAVRLTELIGDGSRQRASFAP